jgi:putative phosphoribosyl transferase
LLQERLTSDLVLGLPRGGVIVAAEVAKTLNRPLDVLVVRKIGHPWNREFAVGALAEGGVLLLDDEALRGQGMNRFQLEGIVTEETNLLEAYRTAFHRSNPVPRAGKSVLLVDDGLATGASMEAAIRAVRQHGAARVVAAVPVASRDAMARVARIADAVIALLVDPQFYAVGQYYDSFPQATDDEVLQALRTAPGQA